MRTLPIALGLLVCLAVVTAPAFGQALEMAAKCDELHKQLAELVKKPGSADAEKIKQAIGVDILDSCPTSEGQIVCFQCLDKDQTLRTLQLLQKKGAQQMELLGFGCKCRDNK
jgi:hypothetical protein